MKKTSPKSKPAAALADPQIAALSAAAARWNAEATDVSYRAFRDAEYAVLDAAGTSLRAAAAASIVLADLALETSMEVDDELGVDIEADLADQPGASIAAGGLSADLADFRDALLKIAGVTMDDLGLQHYRFVGKPH